MMKDDTSLHENSVNLFDMFIDHYNSGCDTIIV